MYWMMIFGVVCWFTAEANEQKFSLSQSNEEFGYTVQQVVQIQVLENFMKLVHVINLRKYEQVENNCRIR